MLEVLVSYEMTAAVLVTATGQLLALILGASVLQAQRHRLAPLPSKQRRAPFPTRDGIPAIAGPSGPSAPRT